MTYVWEAFIFFKNTLITGKYVPADLISCGGQADSVPRELGIAAVPQAAVPVPTAPDDLLPFLPHRCFCRQQHSQQGAAQGLRQAARAPLTSFAPVVIIGKGDTLFFDHAPGGNLVFLGNALPRGVLKRIPGPGLPCFCICSCVVRLPTHPMHPVLASKRFASIHLLCACC
jgi:hypothetical protein